jgi:UDP-3-O-[3-hydroxymyristoyl] glucosamine N-acyltransferase
VYIGNNCIIGDNTTLFSGVKIYHDCHIGNNVIVHSSTVIGSDGFGFAPQDGKEFAKVPQIGNVVIEDNIEIGSNCSIDRATLGSTILRKGVKLDNLVQIAHNVEVGENTVIAGLSGVAGSTKVGKNCMIAAQVGIAGGVKLEAGVTLWGQVGVGKTLTIGENAVVMAQSGIPSSIPGNKVYMGFPPEEAGIKRREYVWIKRIPELWKKVMEDK